MKATSTIQNRTTVNQETFNSKDGENMFSKTFRVLIDQIIRENAKYDNGCYSLFACDLPQYDKRLLLSYLIPIEDYEVYIKDSYKERAAFIEHEDEMQYLINDRINDVWHEDMQEMDRTLCHCGQTGEPYYR